MHTRRDPHTLARQSSSQNNDSQSTKYTKSSLWSLLWGPWINVNVICSHRWESSVSEPLITISSNGEHFVYMTHLARACVHLRSQSREFRMLHACGWVTLDLIHSVEYTFFSFFHPLQIDNSCIFFSPFTWKWQEEYRTKLIIWQTHIRKSIVALKIGQKMPHYSECSIVMDMANGMYYNDIQKCTLFLF